MFGGPGSQHHDAQKALTQHAEHYHYKFAICKLNATDASEPAAI